MQVIQLIIFAGLAAIVLYQLYAVLGRRVGRQPEDAATKTPAPNPRAPERLAEPAEDAGAGLTGLAAVRAIDPSFDLTTFLNGSKSAYEMVVRAFAAGDRATLRNLLSASVLASFESVIDQRENDGHTETVEFSQAPRADLEKADVAGELAKLTVRFLAEFRSRSKSAEGEAVEDRRTAELWTFERNLKNRDPNWTLVHVDAAEA